MVQSNLAKITFIFSIILLLSGCLAAISGPSPELISSDSEWEVSETPVEENGIFLDGYGGENTESTYMYLEDRNEGSFDVVSSDVSTSNEETEISIQIDQSGTSQTSQLVYVEDLSHLDVDTLRVTDLNGNTLAETEPCGCVRYSE